MNINIDLAGQDQAKVNPDTVKGAEKMPSFKDVMDTLHSFRRTSNIKRIAEQYDTVATSAMALILHQQGVIEELNLAKKSIAHITREYNEIRDAYMEVSEKNAQQAKQLAALRIAVRELAGKDPAPTGTAETAQEVPQPKGNPEKTFEERRGCGCGCDMHVSVLKEDELPSELQAVLKQIREFIR